MKKKRETALRSASCILSASLAMRLHGRDACALLCVATQVSSTAIAIWRKQTLLTLLRQTEKLHMRCKGLLRSYPDYKRGSFGNIAQSIILKSFSSRGQGWPIGASQIQRKLCSLFGCFANFIPKSESRTLKNAMCTWMGTFLWPRTLYGCVLFRFLRNATCRSFDKQCAQPRFITWLPSPTQRREWGRRRTCLREMCWLKSIEVEDKKIIWRKVSHYFGIYLSTFVFILNSRFLYHTLNICISFSSG